LKKTTVRAVHISTALIVGLPSIKGTSVPSA